MKHFDEHRINACRKGERAAQQQLFEELYTPMFRVCLRYLADRQEAEDCVMRGFMQMFKNINLFRFEGTHSLYTWVRRIMVNEALMELRRRNNFYLQPVEELPEVPDYADALQQLEAEDLFKLLCKLPAGYRTVLNLYALEGYSHKEIAEALGITESTSKTQYHKARMKLKILIEQEEKSVYGKLGK